MTIIVPIYNEIDNLPRTAQTLKEYLDSASIEAEVLFVDDGSTDGSGEALEKLVEKEPKFSCLRFTTNRGLSTAIKAGIDEAEGELVGYIDADLQTTPFDFEKLLAHIDSYDAVVGYRAKRRDTLSKRIQSKIANAIRRKMVGDGIIDTGCPLKLFRKEAVEKIPFFDGMHRFLPALVQLYGGTVHQVEVRHFPRVAGKSKFNLFNRSVGPLVDMLAFRWMRSRKIEYRIAKRCGR
ncbi:glycosyltransferase family 2 protein [Hydrogenimonas sp.]